jgi:hypothetical protein
MRLAASHVVARHHGVDAVQDPDLPQVAFGLGAAR